MGYVTHVINVVGLFGVLALSLNLLSGFAGLFSVTHGALFGVGAYTYALLTINTGMAFLPALAAGVVAAALVGAVVALPSVRISGEYLVIASLGLQTVLVAAMANMTCLTGGAAGIRDIPRPNLLGYAPSTPASYLPLTIIAVLVTLLLLRLLLVSPYGRALRMVRDDEIAAKAAGKNPVSLKVSAFTFSAAGAGLAGGIYASYVTFIDPSSFAVWVSIFVLTLVLAGGSRTMVGPLVGAVLLVTFDEALRFVTLPPSVAGALRFGAYGLLLILFILLRPEGLVRPRRSVRGVTEPVPEPALDTAGSGGRDVHLPAGGSDGTHVERKVPSTTSPATAAGVSTLTRGTDQGEETAALVCDSLLVRYGTMTALRGVSLGAHEGEVLALLGHNGAGKSTVLKAIAGEIPVAAGRVRFDGEDVTGQQSALPPGRRITLMPQSGGVFGQMSVQENLRMAGFLYRSDPAELQRRIDEVVDLFPSLGTMLGSKGRDLSGGQRRLLALGMSIVPGSRVLLLDEPSIGLSPSLVSSTLAEVRAFTDRLGVVTIVTEQNVRAALAVADRAVVLKAGDVALCVDASDLQDTDDLWRLF